MNKETKTFSMLIFLLSAVVWLTGLSLPVRAAEQAPPPGTIIDKSPDFKTIFIGSPSLEILPDGTYVASHDWFGPKSSKEMVSVFFQSKDKGKTWTKISELKNHYWSILFFHQNALWTVGWAPKMPNHPYRCIAIRKSTDGGKSWTEPKDGKSGLLLSDRNYVSEPNPILFHEGRIWTSFEAKGSRDKSKRNWATDFCPLAGSVPADADLLNRDNWTFSNPVKWVTTPGLGGWLEGNLLVDPDGKMLILCRVDDIVNCGKAARIDVSADGKKASFDPKTGFVAMPGGCKKFMIRFDKKTNLYWGLTNWVHPTDKDHPDKERVRNTLALVCSKDLKKWDIRSIILRHADTTKGFQYVDWRFEGKNDMIFAARTAWEGARNCHDANYLTFHRVKNFRNLTREDDAKEFPVQLKNNGLPITSPSELGLTTADLAKIDGIINGLIEKRNTPGAVLAIGRKGKICYLKTWGNRQVYPVPEPMTVDTLFDLASVTKVAATALSINILIDQKKIDPNAPVVQYLPEFTGKGKDKIRVIDLLTHVSGLKDKYQIYGKEEEIWRSLCAAETKSEPGAKFEYSCMGFIVLGKLVERVSGKKLPDFAKENIYQPLEMTDTMFSPPPEICKRTAPTEKRNGKWLKGQVNDFRSSGMGGNVGNAGLFSTAPDLAKLASVLLNHGRYVNRDGTESRLFSETTFQEMIAPYKVPVGIRGRGWDKKSGKENRPVLMTEKAIGHGGWTGTSLWIDPELDLFVILLGTRRHLDTSKPNIYPSAQQIGDIVIKAMKK